MPYDAGITRAGVFVRLGMPSGHHVTIGDSFPPVE